ncbi:MAG: radical SAM protein [Parcubacteria group bacterium]|jgi:hypothetical protein
MDKENVSQRKKILWVMTGSFSSLCNRGCAHCLDNANMENGCYFSPKNAELLASEIKSEQERSSDDVDSELHLAGNGEILLNPDIVEIFDIIFGQNQKNSGNLVTSGIDSKAPKEKDRLLEILSREYASRLYFNLSFNLFEKRFPKRLIRTLELLFKNGVKKVGIMICQPRQRTLLTSYKLIWLIYHYFIRWVREIDPQASWEEIYDCNLGEGVSSDAKHLSYLDCSPTLWRRHDGFLTPASTELECNGESLSIRSIPKTELFHSTVDMRSIHMRTLRFLTKFGELEIKIKPKFLAKRGRAMKLDDLGFPDKGLCNFLAGSDYSPVHFGADGSWYPNCDCPILRSLRIGYVHEDVRQVWHRRETLRKHLFEKIISDQHGYADICQFCQKTSTQLYYELRNKPLRC